MSKKFFLDTNVLLYQLDITDVRKQAIANDLVRLAISEGNGCISYQVVQECLNVLTRKASVVLDAVSAQRYLDVVLAPLISVPASVNLFHEGLSLQQRYRFSFYDSMIIAAAQASGSATLYSEDMQHGQMVGSLRVINPFLTSDSKQLV